MSILLHLCVCVCVCVCVHVCKRRQTARARDRDQDKKREWVREEQGGCKRGNKEAEIAWIISLYNHHTAHSHCATGQHCGLKAVIY